MTFVAVVLWVSSSALSMAASEHPFHSLMRSTATAWILAAVLLIRYGPAWLRGGWWRDLPGVAIAVIVADLSWQVATGADLFGNVALGPRARGFLPHPNDTAMLAVLLPFAPVWAWPLAAQGAILASSRNAIIGLLAGVGGLARGRWQWWLVAGTCVLTAVIALIYREAVITRGLGRVGQWLVALDLWRSAPWLGHGPHTYIDHYLKTLDRLRPLPFGMDRHAEAGFVPWAHNLYLEVLCERGMLGLGCLSVPMVFVWRRGQRELRAGLLALLVMAVADLTFLKPWVVAAYWGLILRGDLT